LFLKLSLSHLAHVTEDPPQFWKDGTGLAITISCNFESGGQPRFGADPPTPSVQKISDWLALHNQPDYLTRSWYEYGIHEGMPRLLNLYDEFSIKVSCYMVGDAVLASPSLALEVFNRGHEPVGHGSSWVAEYQLSESEETDFIKQGALAIKSVTGFTPIGYNTPYISNSQHTLSILQKLGFRYSVDDLSRDIPFTKLVNGKPFAIVPYSKGRCNDMELVRNQGYNSRAFYEQLVDEFDQLYLESKKKRRLMTFSSHDRIAGSAGVTTAYRKFLEYATNHTGVWFARKDWLADWAYHHGPNCKCNATDFICHSSSFWITIN